MFFFLREETGIGFECHDGRNGYAAHGTQMRILGGVEMQEELHLWTCIACSSFNKFHDGGAGQKVNAFLCFFDLSKVCLNFESG